MDQIARITLKRQLLDSLHPFPHDKVQSLNSWFKQELTYVSTAFSGSTLSKDEVLLVLEKGMTVGGKTMQEYLSVLNYAYALEYINGLVTKKREEITEDDIRLLHAYVVRGIRDEHVGIYETERVSQIMRRFVGWLRQPSSMHPVHIAAQAHYQFIVMHPFLDGNGRTARLLMDLLLMQAGYPPALLQMEDKQRYEDSLQQAFHGGDMHEYYSMWYLAVERALDVCIKAFRDGVLPEKNAEFKMQNAELPTEPIKSESSPKKKTLNSQLSTLNSLLRIGALAKQAGESVPTIRYWTKAGLLKVAEHSKGGYQLYEASMVERAKQIREMQDKERLNLKEIKARLANGV